MGVWVLQASKEERKSALIKLERRFKCACVCVCVYLTLPAVSIGKEKHLSATSHSFKTTLYCLLCPTDNDQIASRKLVVV